MGSGARPSTGGYSAQAPVLIKGASQTEFGATNGLAPAGNARRDQDTRGEHHVYIWWRHCFFLFVLVRARRYLPGSRYAFAVERTLMSAPRAPRA